MLAPASSLWAHTAGHLSTSLLLRLEVYLSEVALIYSALFGGAALLCALGAWHARHLPHRDTRRGLIALLLTSSAWAGAQLAFLLADTHAVAYTTYTIGLVIGFSTVWAWLYFCSAYSGRALHRRSAVVISSALLFGLITVLKVTNAQHGMYFDIHINESTLTAFAVDRYLLYWITTAISYALVIVGFFMLTELWLQVQGRTGAIAGLFGLTLLPIVGNALGLLLPSIADLYHEPLGVAAFALGVLFIARDQLVTIQEVGSRDEPAFVLDADSRLRSYNAAAGRLFPSLQSDALTMPFEAVLPDIAQTRAASHPVLSIPHRGIPQYYRIAETQVRTGGAPIHLLVLMNVTERERQFREQEQFLQSITESVSDGIFQVSFESGIVYANHAMANMLGYDTPVALQTIPSAELFADAEDARRLHDTLHEEGIFTGEVALRRCDGSHFVGRISATLIRNDHGEPSHYNGVIVDLTQQKERERELQTAKEEAEAAAQFKEHMLATMSHEVRTPLTAIIGFAEVLTSNTTGSTKRFAERIGRGGRRLERTLEAMLNLSKLRSNTYTPHPEPVHLPSFVEDTMTLFQARAAAKDITLTAAPPPEAVNGAEVNAQAPLLDPDSCRHILNNLIDNAIKFTLPGGRVTVQAYRTCTHVCFVVEDTGIGIAPDVQDVVFEPFKQESEGHTRTYEGTGLGLAIVHQVVELMGGTIDLDSTKGEGSRFTVWLPLPDEGAPHTHAE